MALDNPVGSGRNLQNGWTGVFGLPFLMLFMMLNRALFLLMLLVLFLVLFIMSFLALLLFLGVFLMLLLMRLFLLLLSIRLLRLLRLRSLLSLTWVMHVTSRRRIKRGGYRMHRFHRWVARSCWCSHFAVLFPKRILSFG